MQTTLTCEYCQGVCEAGPLKCPNCSAPLNPSARPATDYRRCPSCQRKLLALGSPACNYCGQRLPEDYIKAHEAHGMQRPVSVHGRLTRAGRSYALENPTDLNVIA